MENVGNRTFCVVEDDPLLRLDAVLLLEEAGYEVEQFPSGEAALTFLEKNAPTVVLIFTDVRMPGGVDGMALAEMASKRWPWIKLLITSGTESKLEDRIPAGSTFFRKPWRPTEVLAHATMATPP